MEDCRRFRITGKVQGVYYRAATQSEAVRLGVTGWVRNLPNGDVEVLACGQAGRIDALLAWLWQGPPRAQVSAVEQEDTEREHHDSFEVRYD